MRPVISFFPSLRGQGEISFLVIPKHRWGKGRSHLVHNPPRSDLSKGVYRWQPVDDE